MKAFTRLLTFLVACSLSVVSFAVDAVSDKSIIWAQPENFPPLYIATGPDKGTGIGDRINQDIKALLPQFNHQDFYANNPRILSKFRKGANICGLLHYTSYRDRYIVFSKPVVRFSSPQIFINANNSKAFSPFNRGGEWRVTKAEIFKIGRGIVFGHIPDRSYGEDLDKAIKEYEKTLSLVEILSSSESRLKMLLTQRVDYIIEFPWLVAYGLKKLNSNDQVKQITISDAPAYTYARLGCSNTEWGNRVIDAVDRVADDVFLRSQAYVKQWDSEAK